MNISYIDILILLPLFLGLVRGLMRGLVTELIAILAVILGAVGARIWGSMCSAWLMTQFNWPDTVCDVTAYSLLFLAITIALNLLGKVFSRLLKVIHLGWLNRLLGGVFGTLKWAVIVLTLVFLVDKLDQQFHFIKEDAKKKSVTYEPTVKSANACLSVVRS